jgi:hypothetical protein
LYQTIPLTYEERRVIDDARFSVVRPDVNYWNLQIQDVKLEDGGQYRCTVNTKPVINKIVSLMVTGLYLGTARVICDCIPGRDCELRHADENRRADVRALQFFVHASKTV